MNITYLFHQLAVGATIKCPPNQGVSCDTGLPNVKATNVQLQQILQIVLAIFGAIAVLMLIIAALRYVTAQGNPQETSKARGTIIYALVGIVVVIMAEAIVGFVLGKL